MEETFVLKKRLRAEIRDRVSGLSPAERIAAAGRVAARLEVLERFSAARTVACFMPLPDEVPVEGYFGQWSRGRRMVFPVVEGDRMRFFEYDPAEMRRGRFGIMEPFGTAEVAPQSIDAMLVPGRAFTRNGLRLGRGRGYYDRYLSQDGAAGIYTIGICFACQLVETLPVTPDDFAVDTVVVG